MRAAVCRSYGPPDVVEVSDDYPEPSLGPGQVRVQVHAAAVNFPDVLLVANRYQATAATPFVPGSELAGVLTEVAGDVTGVDVGDRVFGSTMFGAFAEQAVVAAETVRRIPAGVGDHHAAAFGVAHQTAYHTLRTVAAVQPGEELVVLGAGGGVGLAAVQLGTAFGASVTAVASSAEKLAAARTQGATTLIDRKAGDLRQSLREALPHGADVVIDPVGGDLSEPALRALHWGGRFVTVGYASGEIPKIPLNLVLLKGVHIVGYQLSGFAAHAPDEVLRNERELLDLLAAQRVLPYIGATFPLDEVATALRQLADGEAVGKIVLDISA